MSQVVAVDLHILVLIHIQLALVDMEVVVMVVVEKLRMLFKTPDQVAVDLKGVPAIHQILAEMVLPVLFSSHILPN
tara:strand:- start:4 stop:231 length:228 start_codon:yes stop_codon:yes gene_type:complete